MPLVRRNRQVRSLLLGPPAVDRVVDRDVVLECVGARDVVVVRVLRAPDDAARLVLFAGDRLELDLHETVAQIGAVFQTNRIRRLSRLLQHVRSARCRVVADHCPFRGARAGLRGRPTGWCVFDIVLIECGRGGCRLWAGRACKLVEQLPYVADDRVAHRSVPLIVRHI